MKTDRTNDRNVFSDAVETLRRGGVILYPTDTVWGLGCDATNPEAVRKIYDIKKRPDSKSLVLLASDLDMVARYIREIPDMAIRLVEVNDRPMTIIYPDAITGKEYRGLAENGRWKRRDKNPDGGFLQGSGPQVRKADSIHLRKHFRRTYTEKVCRDSAGYKGCRRLYP